MSRAPKAWRSASRGRAAIHELVGQRVTIKRVPRFARVEVPYSNGAVVDLRGAHGVVKQASQNACAVALGGRGHWFQRRDFDLDAASKTNAPALNRRGKPYLTKPEVVDVFARGLVPYLSTRSAGMYRAAWREFVSALVAAGDARPAADAWTPPPDPRRP